MKILWKLSWQPQKNDQNSVTCSKLTIKTLEQVVKYFQS